MSRSLTKFEDLSAPCLLRVFSGVRSRGDGAYICDMTAARVSTLDERYLRQDGTIFLTGIQALVRMLLDRARHDQRAGLRTAAYVSGYEGSPLAGYDLELAGQAGLLREHRVTHQPGVNEELAATAVSGTQLARPRSATPATTASPASGTGRRPALTGPPTRCGTPT